MKLEPVCGAAVVMCLSLAAPAGAQVTASPAVRAIEPLLTQQLQAANAHDTDRFLSSYLHDSTFVLVFNTQLIHGFEAVCETRNSSSGGTATVRATSCTVSARLPNSGVVNPTVVSSPSRSSPPVRHLPTGGKTAAGTS